VVLEEVSINEHCSFAFLCNSDHAVDMLELLKDADRKERTLVHRFGYNCGVVPTFFSVLLLAESRPCGKYQGLSTSFSCREL
jgi:hypothetical protein